ncbi:sensor histidine kinase [Arcicella rosea]|uniref:Sensor histidine kinase YesM n=1 Tax=Arcicella rosea TaxID=502909 RepID=A0A841EUL2_9BACT|nr:histidine kinase [Arcicella rosea]MBB6004328.1 sensor histidine kinase YesM [Arcicella rosea]
MNSHEKFRTYEIIFILFAVIFYVVRRLFGIAYDFDMDIGYAERINIPHRIIWADLANYDQIINNIFPTITAAVLFTAAWFVFHYFFFPAIKQKNYEISTVLWFVFVVILVLASCFIYKEYKLYWRFRYDFNSDPVGFKVFSLFRKLHVLTDAFACIIIIALYEVVAQLYYYTVDLFEKERLPKYQFLNNLILFLALASISLFTLFGEVANLIVGLTGLVIGLTQLLLIVGLHYLSFKIVIPYFANINYSKKNEIVIPLLWLFVYGLFNIILYLLWYRIALTVYYFGLIIVPHLLGFFSALIRWLFFQEKKQLQTQVFQKSAELITLRSQINPHFLFNAMNTLYAVALKENAEKTSNGIQKLGDMMRFMLHENHQERIPLSKEIEYLENFIEIQRMRLDESHEIEIRVNIQTLNHEIYIAPMLLNPFVENAFKHGISFRKPSWIYITLTFDAQKLYFKVHNSLHPKNENDTEKQSGIGLENVQKRLELIYPQRHTLEIQQSEQDYFVSLTLGIF